MLNMNLYDIIAMLCFKISSLNTDSQSELYRKFWSNPQIAMTTIYERFPFLNPKTNVCKILFDTLEDEELIALINYVETTEGGDISLLRALDSLIDFEESLNKFLQSNSLDVSEFSSLNSNVKECKGKLIPRFKYDWMKKQEHTLAQLSEKPISVMGNYIWIKESETINRWNVRNVYSSKWSYDGKNPYTIVCSPLINVQPFQYQTKISEGVNYFYITGYDEELQKNIIQRVKSVLEYSGQIQAGITMFPEISVSPEGHSLIRGWVGENYMKDFSKIICLPSSEYVEEEKWVNQTQIISDDGELICKYNKQQAFQSDDIIEGEVERKSFEPIKSDHKITIIHGSGIGRIGVIICADIFNDELLCVLLKEYSINMLLILAYSNGFDRFEKSILKAGVDTCEVVWCNCCGAYYKKDGQGDNYPVVAYYPYGHHTGTDKKILGRCSSSAHGHCNGCMIVIRIDSSYTGVGHSLTQKKMEVKE